VADLKLESESSEIDIIIPTYNGSNHIGRLLRSIENQTSSAFTCYVIDDYSNDNTVSLIKREFPWVNLIEQSKNCGPAQNRNIAISQGNSPFIAIFDDDAFLQDPNWLNKALRLIKKEECIGQLASMIISGFDKDVLLDCGICKNGYLFGGVFHNQKINSTSGKHNYTRRVLGACSAGTVIRRDVFELVGGFDKKYRYPAEDLDLSLRIHLAGYDVVYHPSLVTYHYESQAMGKSLKNKFYLYRKNCLLAFVENYPIRHIIPIISLLSWTKIFIPLVRWTNPMHFYNRKKRNHLPQETKDYIKAFWILLTLTPNIINKRKFFDSIRKKSRGYLLEVNRIMKEDLS
jgi:GT2 family glycosyltransferase